jgi:hydroxymethylglutaryl-CoA synthase
MTDMPLPPSNTVGILALEVYTPSTYITQASLEEHAGVAAGKYTIGLGQQGLAITGDAEDINSICLTAVASLLEKYVLETSACVTFDLGYKLVLYDWGIKSIDASETSLFLTYTLLLSLFITATANIFVYM